MKQPYLPLAVVLPDLGKLDVYRSYKACQRVSEQKSFVVQKHSSEKTSIALAGFQSQSLLLSDYVTNISTWL